VSEEQERRNYRLRDCRSLIGETESSGLHQAPPFHGKNSIIM